MSIKNEQWIRHAVINLFSDQLLANSIYLFSSTVVMSVFGFVFWLINSHLFTPEQVGLATTLISVMTLITSFSMVGLNTGLIKYLPLTDQRNEHILSVVTTVATISILFTLTFLLLFLTPKLSFLAAHPVTLVLFVGSVLFSSLNRICESIFISLRNTKHIFVKNSIFSLMKLLIPALLVSAGALGIFYSWSLSLAFAFSYCLLVLIKKYKIRFMPQINVRLLADISLYSFGNYISDILDYLPILLLPVLITNRINAEATAYYYMAHMVANLLYVIPESIGHSLFAEGSNNVNGFSHQTKKARLYIAGLLIPSVLFAILFGRQILLAFGKNYSTEGFKLLQLLALSVFLYAANVVFSTRFKVMHQVKKTLISSFIGCIGYFSLIVLFLRFGIIGVGLARIGSQSILLACNYMLIKTKKLHCSTLQ